MAKLFDNVANLKFSESESGEPTKEAIGMYSKEDEYVAFHTPCDCSGQVIIIFLCKILIIFSHNMPGVRIQSSHFPFG